MSLANAFGAADILEAVLTGKQPLAPILADFEAALVAALRGVRGLQAVNTEIQAARGLVPPASPPRPRK